MKQLLLHAGVSKLTLALLDNDILSDLAVETAGEEDIVGRVYRGVIKNVVPSLNGMFIDIGIGRNAFLRTKEIISPNEPHTEGCTVLVQVEKDSTETKGPLVTEKISFAGEYAVALTDTGYIGISKKIQDEEKRKSLRNYAKAVCPAGIGLIIRTAAENAKEEDFRKDITYLVNNMTVVKRRFKLGKEPALLYRDGDLLVRSIRDYMGRDIDSLIVDDKDAYDRLIQLAENMDHEASDRIVLYKEKENLFRRFHVEEQINQLFSRVVPLSNGGSLIIDYTEALTVIDVNSGSFKGNKIPHDELAFLINKAAAYEIARQIRLRGIGGIIMVDFIDMKKKKEQYELLDILRAAVRTDRAKTVVCGMTTLGLVEITRKRTTHRTWEYYFDSCPLCHGTGHVLSAKSVADKILEELKNRRWSGPFKNDLEIHCNTEVADILKQTKAESLIKNMAGRSVTIMEEPSFAREVYTLLSI